MNFSVMRDLPIWFCCQLYTQGRQLQSTFGVINLAIVDGETRELPLKEMVWVFLDHRRTVVRRRTEF